MSQPVQATTLPDTGYEAVERLAALLDAGAAEIESDGTQSQVGPFATDLIVAAATLRALRAERDGAWDRAERGDRRASSLDSDLLAIGRAIQELHRVAVTAGAIGPAARPFAEADNAG